MRKVVKRKGKIVPFDEVKIEKAILKAGAETKVVDKNELDKIIKSAIKRVKEEVKDGETVSVNKINLLVNLDLEKKSPKIAEAYCKYHSLENVLKDVKKVIDAGDKENANKNSSIISTKKEITAGILSEQLMLKYELPKHIAEAHINGDIYIHDLRDRLFGSINCCLFDMANVLKGGFCLNDIYMEEPSSFEGAIDLLNDVLLVASGQQFGGFTVPNIDETLGVYVEKTYNTLKKELGEFKSEEYIMQKLYKIVYRRIKSLEYKIRVVNNSTGQTPFTTFTFGLGTDKWSRMVTKAILEVRMAKFNGITAIFPKLVFLHRNEINGLPSSPNYDLKKLAIECSKGNLYPDFLSLDAGYLGEVYDRCKTAISPMGCRAFLSPYWDENGKELYIGRFNLGAISLGLPRYAIEAEGSKEKFFEILDKNFDIALEYLLFAREKYKKIKAGTNPLLFCEGGSIKNLDPNETIEPLLDSSTMSFGYIGLHEVVYLLTGKGLHEDNTFAIEVMKHIKKLVDDSRDKYNILFALYGTPSEGLCDKWLKKDREKFGIIEGVTDKKWYTNSFHIDVRAERSAFEKQDDEIPLFEISTGGRIHYSEYPQNQNLKAFESAINRAMSLGYYYGINLENSTCLDCKTQGEFADNICTNCGSTNITTVTRVCGYLGYKRQNGDTRYNEGKDAEVDARVKHFGVLC